MKEEAMKDPLTFMERDSLTIWGENISAQMRSEQDLDGVERNKLALYIREDTDPERVQGELLIGENDFDKLRELLNEAQRRR